MEYMRDWVKSALEYDFLPDPEASKSPLNRDSLVRIAVLDTGACFQRFAIDHIYDGRLKEVRSWRPKASSRARFDNKIGEIIPFDEKPFYDMTDLVGEDNEGHGTHTTSLLLESTRDTNFEVYVAKVFDRRNDTQGDKATQEEIEEGIANVSSARKIVVECSSQFAGYLLCRGSLECRYHLNVLWVL